jgi:hypothetical protein
MPADAAEQDSARLANCQQIFTVKAHLWDFEGSRVIRGATRVQRSGQAGSVVGLGWTQLLPITAI